MSGKNLIGQRIDQTPIVLKYVELGGAAGFLGPPTTHEMKCPDGTGRLRHYQNGSIYWSPQTDAHEIHGEIRDLWESIGWERGPLGYPITDVLTSPDEHGRLTHFQGGSIYWTTSTGAHEVHGDIRIRWGETGWERGPLGYPVTSEFRTFDLAAPDKRYRISAFQHGFIAYSEADGQTRVVVPASYKGLTLVVAPIFWGEEWNQDNPTCPGQGWMDVDKALNDVLSAGVANGLQPYGITAAVKAKAIWLNAKLPSNFRTEQGFTPADLTGAILDAVVNHGAPTPMHSHVCYEGLRPLTSMLSVYQIFLPSGCRFSEDPDQVMTGVHFNADFLDPEKRYDVVNDIKVCWIGQGSGALSDTLNMAIHELVEAADDAAGIEIADRCEDGNKQNPDNAGFYDTVTGVSLRSYWSHFHNRCILPPKPDPQTNARPLQ